MGLLTGNNAQPHIYASVQLLCDDEVTSSATRLFHMYRVCQWSSICQLSVNMHYFSKYANNQWMKKDVTSHCSKHTPTRTLFFGVTFYLTDQLSIHAQKK